MRPLTDQHKAAEEMANQKPKVAFPLVERVEPPYVDSLPPTS